MISKSERHKVHSRIPLVQSMTLSLTVALVQAEAAVAEAELSCPVRLRQARVYPGAVVPAAVRFGVDFQTGLDKVQLRLIQLLHLALLSRGRTEKYITVFCSDMMRGCHF